MPDKIPITTEYIKLDQFLKFSGIVPTEGKLRNEFSPGRLPSTEFPAKCVEKSCVPGM